MTTELFQADLMGMLGQLPGSAGFAAFRKTQLAAFQDAGLPTTRDEDWRYTKLSRIEQGGFLQPNPPDVSDPVLAEQVATAGLDLPDANRLVFIGRLFCWPMVPDQAP